MYATDANQASEIMKVNASENWYYNNGYGTNTTGVGAISLFMKKMIM